MAATERFFALSLALVSACSWNAALESDPSSWSPRKTNEISGEDDDGSMNGCDETLLGERLAVSTKATRSHAHGKPCLEGCHESGGSARSTFEIAGSAFVSEGSRNPARAGMRIHGVGGETLEVDLCGNFYAIREQLSGSAKTTQPFVLEPSFRKMEKSMQLIKNPGDCNSSGCHDFSEKGAPGVFF